MSEVGNTTISLDFGAGNVAVMPSRCLRIAVMPTDCDICAQVCPFSAITPKELPEEAEEAEEASKAAEPAAEVAEPIVATSLAATEPQATVAAEEATKITGSAAATEAATAGEVVGAEAVANASETTATANGVGETPKPNVRSVLEKKQGVEVSADCIHCGICATVCPVDSLSTTLHHSKGFERQVIERASKLEGVALSCARAIYGVAPRLASKAITVPCLAALSSEAWFLAAAMARDALFNESLLNDDQPEQEYIDNLRVYLPSLICDDCPVNLCGDAEKTYMASIAEAESWGAINIELVDEAEAIDPSYSGGILSMLSDSASGDKREAASQLAGNLMRSWKNAGDDLLIEQKRVEFLAKRRKQTLKKRPVNQSAPRPFGKKSQRRHLLYAALEQKKELEADVELLCAGTQAELCTGCGTCTDVCSLGARRLVSSNSVLYFGKLPEDKRPQGKMAAITDQLCCLGCSACVIACPTGACILTKTSGEEFMNLRQS